LHADSQDAQARAGPHADLPAEIQKAEDKVNKRRESVPAISAATGPPNSSVPSLLTRIGPLWLTSAHSELQRTEVSVIFYQRYIEMARGDCRCPLCERTFDATGVDEFVRKVGPVPPCLCPIRGVAHRSIWETIWEDDCWSF